MNRMKHLFCVLLLAALGSFSFKANAYTERNMLQKAADETTLKNVLVMKQAGCLILLIPIVPPGIP